MDDNHKKFLSHLDESANAVHYIAKWLLNKGYNVQINAASRANSHEDWKAHVDSGDLFIQQRIEVKHLSCDFSSAETWPFGGKFIVCAKHSWDRAQPKPYAEERNIRPS